MITFIDFDEVFKNAKEVTDPRLYDKDHKEWIYHPKGLFSQQIFGPIRDYHCACGKYVSQTYAGHVCEDCGVEVTTSLVRRVRYAKISLPVKIFHPLVLELITHRRPSIKSQILENESLKPIEFVNRLLEEVQFFKEKYPGLIDKIPIFIKTIPVIPPELRPIYQIGRIQRIDEINKYYLIILAHLKEAKKNPVSVEDVHALLQISLTRRFYQLFQYIKSKITKKEGILRQNLLGKDTDFSARSVIIPDVELPHDTCGLPLQMVCELFKPDVINELTKQGVLPAYATEIVNQFIRDPSSCSHYPEVYQALMKVLKERDWRVALNRQPTLHKSSIETFKISISEGKAIKIPPTVVVPYNADFDGDTMAVYRVLCEESKEEFKEVLHSELSSLIPGSMSAEIVTQHSAYGYYNLTKDEPDPDNIKLELTESDIKELIKLVLHTKPPKFNDFKGLKYSDTIKYKDTVTTFGRLVASIALREEINYPLDKSKVNKILTKWLRKKYVEKENLPFDIDLNQIFRVGAEASRDLTISLEDLQIDREWIKQKRKLFKEFVKERKRFTSKDIQQLKQMLDKLTEEALEKSSYNLKAMIKSKAKAKKSQFAQRFVAKGFISDITNKIIRTPILSGFYDGLSPKQYLISCAAARKGSFDRSNRTSESGWLTRRLVYALQDLELDPNLEDCGTDGYLTIKLEKPIAHLFVYRYYRFPGEKEWKLLLPEDINKVINKTVEVRSPLFCKSPRICKKCFGELYNALKTKYIGIIAAQALGERCTQLVMRTFHTGGVANISEKLTQFRYPTKYFYEDDELQICVKDGYSVFIENIPEDDIKKESKTFINDTVIQAQILDAETGEILDEVEIEVIKGTQLIPDRFEDIFVSSNKPLFKLPDESTGIVTATKYVTELLKGSIYPDAERVYQELLNLFGKDYNILSIWLELIVSRLAVAADENTKREICARFIGNTLKARIKPLHLIPYERPLVAIAFENFRQALKSFLSDDVYTTLPLDEPTIIEKIIMHKMIEANEEKKG